MKPRHTPIKHSRLSRIQRGKGEALDSPPEKYKAEGHSVEKPSEVGKRNWREILWRTKEKIKEHNLSIVAAGAAFYIFLGIIPALAALISIYGLVADAGTIQQQVDALAGFLPQDVIKILDEQMMRISRQTTGATLGAAIGILLALWSGAKAMKSLMMALNITYDEDETRGFFRLNGTALGLSFAATIGAIIAVGLVVALPPLLRWAGLGSSTVVLVSMVRWPVLAIFAMLGFSLLYRFGPDRDPEKWGWVTWGASAATIIWLAVSVAFSFYVSHFGKYNKTYGSLGAVVVLLLWILLSVYAVLVGSELNAALERQRKLDQAEDA